MGDQDLVSGRGNFLSAGREIAGSERRVQSAGLVIVALIGAAKIERILILIGAALDRVIGLVSLIAGSPICIGGAGRSAACERYEDSRPSGQLRSSFRQHDCFSIFKGGCSANPRSSSIRPKISPCSCRYLMGCIIGWCSGLPVAHKQLRRSGTADLALIPANCMRKGVKARENFAEYSCR